MVLSISNHTSVPAIPVELYVSTSAESSNQTMNLKPKPQILITTIFRWPQVHRGTERLIVLLVIEEVFVGDFPFNGNIHISVMTIRFKYQPIPINIDGWCHTDPQLPLRYSNRDILVIRVTDNSVISSVFDEDL